MNDLRVVSEGRHGFFTTFIIYLVIYIYYTIHQNMRMVEKRLGGIGEGGDKKAKGSTKRNIKHKLALRQHTPRLCKS